MVYWLSLKYDPLGRLINRVDEDQTQWFYDKTLEGVATAGSQGKLMAIVVRSGNSPSSINSCLSTDHCTQYFYDQFSRLTDTLVLNPNEAIGFTNSIAYDSIGRPYEARDMLNGTVLTDRGSNRRHHPVDEF